MKLCASLIYQRGRSKSRKGGEGLWPRRGVQSRVKHYLCCPCPGGMGSVEALGSHTGEYRMESGSQEKKGVDS